MNYRILYYPPGSRRIESFIVPGTQLDTWARTLINDGRTIYAVLSTTDKADVS